MTARISRDDLARRIAADIPEGAYVNLGIGAPTLVADHLPRGVEIVMHTENGLLGMGSAPDPSAIDPDLINAGKQPVTEVAGAAYFHHADSFAMMRGGHIDFCVLGAYQVSQTGDLANWSTGDPDAIPAVGGAMDLAIGAKQVYVMTDLFTKQGESKLVERCSYPLTGVGCVTRVYTDHAVFDLTSAGFRVREFFAGNTVAELEARTGLVLTAPGDAAVAAPDDAAETSEPPARFEVAR
ncbi:3-oxoacid CoA-transferase subunit B [Agromyces aerolatus]|uniref:3-oxoacid CoA-transferase subunit B n=1 Tax=Agromyces sp. LY-1074 TaxID=3074080 RepID=UPI00285B3662|nr:MULTISPECIES: 3-oxoacid CoA-transferase subunit B [unclassified Agromyces]MDR5700502.1 3-oxoacid CoA-transferase subunit B [Agromyces sp. LY-1074]MDR5707023.1 3-oxoacid CoA-transferase subunit B [Agromyces sp. LY-1358]